ncbi:MAG: chorismate synthase [bacterium]
MNRFGRIFNIQIFGESHGNAVGMLIDGVPPGIFLVEKHFVHKMSKRKPGAVGTTARVEDDKVNIVSGVYRDFTTGAPCLLTIDNKNTAPSDYDRFQLHFRPGHSDFTSFRKSEGFADFRGGGHFSGRLTSALVAAGVVAKKIIPKIDIKCKILTVGGVEDYADLLLKAKNEGDSLGALLECTVSKVPIGLGEPFFDSVESVLSHLLFSIPGIKGVEFGSGFASASMFGSDYNDLILDASGRTKTNNSGGINGGIANGNPIVFRVAARPTSSIGKPQETYNFETFKIETLEIGGRHDVCFGLRLPAVIEAVTAIALADLILLNSSI